MSENDTAKDEIDRCDHQETIVVVGGPFNEPMAVCCNDCGDHL